MAIVISDTNVPDRPPDMLCACVCDSSGSMESLKDAAIKGLNAFIRTQKSSRDQMLFYLSTFNSASYNERIVWHRMRDTKFLDQELMEPYGGTPLFDAIMRCGETTYDLWQASGSKLKVVMAILTDGQENGSTKYKLGDVKEFVSARTVEGWEFIFIAPNGSSEREAHKMGFTNIVRYDINRPLALTQAIKEVSITIEDMRRR